MKYLLFKTTNINQKGIGLDPFLGSILDIHHNVTILGGAASEEARGWGSRLKSESQSKVELRVDVLERVDAQINMLQGP